MNQRSKMGVRSIAVAIIIAGVAISASVLLVASSSGQGTRTVTRTTTVEGQGSVQLHKVTFNQTGIYCGAGVGKPFFLSEWYVTLGNATIVQPSNATLPFPTPNVNGYGEDYAMISKIVFTVPDGSYRYSGSLGINGTAIVNGSDIVIPVYDDEVIC